jgi:hypothetical protein
MKSSGPLKHLIFAFIIAVVVYAVFFYGIEHRRTVNGPWQVTFTNSEAGLPELIVSQPKLKVSNLKIEFLDDKMPLTNSNGRLIFDTPKEVPLNVPFGKCIFMDTTFLPGTVTFDLFGHEIELLPRVLIINKKEYPWRSEMTISLSGTNRIAPTMNPVR